MPTTKPRLNISLPRSVREALIRMARRDKLQQATTAAPLLPHALELEEDQIWENIAKRRDTKSARYLPPDKVWR